MSVMSALNATVHTCSAAAAVLTVLKKQWLGNPFDWTLIFVVPFSRKHETQSFLSKVHGLLAV